MGGDGPSGGSHGRPGEAKPTVRPLARALHADADGLALIAMVLPVGVLARCNGNRPGTGIARGLRFGAHAADLCLAAESYPGA